MRDLFQKKISIRLIGDVLSLLLLLVGVGCLCIGGINRYYNAMLTGLILIWISGVFFCLCDVCRRILVLLFEGAIFLFLISRILIPALDGAAWWSNYSEEANVFAVTAISLSLIFIYLGAIIIELICSYRAKNPPQMKKQSKKIYVSKTVLRALLAVAFVCMMITEADKLLFMADKAYEDYYTQYVSQVWYPVRALAGCAEIFLCMLLAVKPSKKESTIWLSIYIISTIPTLLIGARGSFMLAIVFSFVYYYFRHISEGGWIGKIEKIVVVIMIPLLVLFMGSYNYIRGGNTSNLSPVALVSDFMYKQGTTYDTVLQGYEYQDSLPGRDNKIYTFGALTDSILHSTLGEIIFDAESIGNGNSVEMAENSHSFAHGISYVVLGDKYLAGEGRGSSYIIENYIDFGWVGVCLFSLCIGMFCAVGARNFGKGWLSSTIILMLLTSFFFMPRAGSLECGTFIVSYKFWTLVIGTVFLSRIWEKTKKTKFLTKCILQRKK